MAERPRLKVPKEAKKGEVIEIKTLIAHAMESGLRKDDSGALVPRKIINRFTCEFNGKPVIKVSYVNGNELTVFYLSADAKHVVGAVSSISAPATHAPPQNVATAQPVANQPTPQSSVTFTPVKYPEITNAYGSPIGYVNAQGQAVYFPNGQMPSGFSIGPNHTIETYVKS